MDLPGFTLIWSNRDPNKKLGYILVYIPPKATAKMPCEVFHETVATIQTKHPDALFRIDFSHVFLSSQLTGFTQFVGRPARENKNLDLLYANAKEAYRTTVSPPHGRSAPQLGFSAYMLQTLCAETTCSQTQSENGHLMLLRLEGTAVNAHTGMCCWKWMKTLQTLTDRLIYFTEYVNFCTDTFCFHNNKHWITSDIKANLNQKKGSFQGW